jgi:hypothetical protein
MYISNTVVSNIDSFIKYTLSRPIQKEDIDKRNEDIG